MEKRPVRKKKSKIAHKILVTKATDLKTIFLKAFEKCIHRFTSPSLIRLKYSYFCIYGY